MRDLRFGIIALTVLCVPGRVLSFVPCLPPARPHLERDVEISSKGSPIRRCASRALWRIRASGGAGDGHVVSQLGGEEDRTLTQGASAGAKLKSRWAKGQSDWAPRAKSTHTAVEVTPKAKSRWSKGQANWKTRVDDGVEADSGDVGDVDGGIVGEAIEKMTPEEGETLLDVAVNARAEETLAGGLEDGKEIPAPLPEVQVTKRRLKKYNVKDFEDSSWTVGIQWKSNPKKVVTTKVALKKDGTVVWLDKGKGSWSMRSKSRDLVFYRDFFWNWNGKRIYSAKLLSNTCDLYLEGVIKGWAPFLPLGVFGYFQAVRRGVTIDENTPRPPWEDRPVPEVELPPSAGKRSNKAITAPVDLS